MITLIKPIKSLGRRGREHSGGWVSPNKIYNWSIYCAVGWVDIGTVANLPLKFVVYLRKVEKMTKNLFDHTVYSTLHIYRWNFFVYNLKTMGIKRRRILRRFKKNKLTFVTKCIYTKFFQNNMLNWDLHKKSQFSMFLGITFLGAFFNKVSLYF
jgi:hypothetical protein